ncbi:hypothetical protein BpHYR1_009729 [Brachionus plicatilis]|uniref:Uncharacterized protein n=1 Tax=Brachionus plicatilis TaxID=10195 RepID=A0A3M7R440_BRAPC|nr:hypothetical protein BpHYR1_009729 [Brachionus plicatilis]
MLFFDYLTLIFNLMAFMQKLHTRSYGLTKFTNFLAKYGIKFQSANFSKDMLLDFCRYKNSG